MIETHIEAQAVLGPGLPDWTTARAVLSGEAAYAYAPAPDPAPALLPANERRRASASVRWALAVGHAALRDHPGGAGDVATVFASCGGDGMITHQICETLASSACELSPTRFHNSVHNAPAGYWSIAMRSHAPSTSVCGYDGSFAAGLLEAATQVATEARRVLLIAYDIPYPSPLHGLWPVAHPFAVALLLAPAHAAGVPLRLRVAPGVASQHWPVCVPRELAPNPAARALPLLALLARGAAGRADLPLNEAQHVAAEVGN